MNHHASAADISTDPDDVRTVHEILSDTDIAMVTTIDSTSSAGRLVSRPLTTQVAEEDGDVLFLVRDDSAVVRDVEANPQVNAAYSSRKAWVSLSGTASVVRDRRVVEDLWTKASGAFLDGGPEDPHNVVLKIDGDTAEYWGGTSLVGTLVKTARTIVGDNDDSGAGPTVVDLP